MLFEFKVKGNMIFILIVIVISIIIVCWGKISLDALNNKPQRSFVKTLIYLFLAVIVCIIYYKTTTVTPIHSTIKISKYKGLVDESGNNIDGALVTINYRMHNHSVKDSLSYIDYRANGGFRVMICPDNDSLLNIYSRYDSTKNLSIYNCIGELYHIKCNNIIPDSNVTQNFIEKFANAKFRKDLEEIINSNTILDSLSDSTQIKIREFYNYALSDINRLYQIVISTNKYPSFLPYDIIEDIDSCIKNPQKESLCYYYKDYSNSLCIPRKDTCITDKKLLKELNLWKVPVYKFYVAESTNLKELSYEVETDESDINHIDYFTASDISQASFEAHFTSDIPIKYVLILFDEPIDITSITPEPDEVALNYIEYSDPNKLEIIRRSPIEFHTKFPRYENKQMVRSLILTTILVGVISLFCINFFILIRGLYKYSISEEFVKRQKKLLKLTLYILRLQLFLIILWVFVMYVKYAFGDTVVFSKLEEMSIINSAIFFIIVIAGIIWGTLLIIVFNLLSRIFKIENIKRLLHDSKSLVSHYYEILMK